MGKAIDQLDNVINWIAWERTCCKWHEPLPQCCDTLYLNCLWYSIMCKMVCAKPLGWKPWWPTLIVGYILMGCVLKMFNGRGRVVARAL